MSNEAATVRWFPEELYRSLDRPPEPAWGKDRTFESVDKAVIFVMEELSVLERTNASIATSSRDIGMNDIERIYAALKK
jgi:hypothetical protein